MHLRDILFFDDLRAVLEDSRRVQELREGILAGDVYVFRHFLSLEKILEIRGYLEDVGRGSLPNYQRIEPNCPNFHRMDRWDPRAHVKGCMHYFSFFPWNHDVFGIFDLFRPVYHLKNLISGLPAESFLGWEPDRGCTSRLSFQCYPRGIGGLNRHQDPVDYHQITVPSMLMSQKGVDFEQGGAYIERNESERIVLDDMCDAGDVAFFNANAFHGVERIDPGAELDWLSFRGRWALVFTVNKLADNAAIGDSRDLEPAP